MFVGVVNQLFGLADDADGLEIVERVVSEGILESVAARDLGQVVEGVVVVGHVRQLGAVSGLARHLGGVTRLVVFIHGLVAAAVGHHLVAGGFGIDVVGGRVAARVGLTDQVVAGVFRAVTGGIKSKRTIDRAEFAVGEGGLGEGVAKLVHRLLEFRCGVVGRGSLGGVLGDVDLVVRGLALGFEFLGGEIRLDGVTGELNVVEIRRADVVAVVAVDADRLDLLVFLLCELHGDKLPFFGAGREGRRDRRFSRVAIAIADHRTQLKTGGGRVFALTGGEAAALCPAGEGEGLTRVRMGFHGHILMGAARIFQITGDHQRAAHVESRAGGDGRAGGGKGNSRTPKDAAVNVKHTGNI